MQFQAGAFLLVALCVAGRTLATPSTAGTQRSFTWCCISSAELDKCSELNALGSALFDFDCILPSLSSRGSPTDACVALIKSGSAHVMILDGGDIIKHLNSGIKVVGAEDVGVGTANYYAVAVVRKGTMRGTGEKMLGLKEIDQFRTCHTGVGKTSGWNMPMGLFLRKYDEGRGTGANPANIKSSCAPGADLGKYQYLIPGGRAEKWCKNCVGDGTDDKANVCDRSSEELYYGYAGAFRCLQDGAGDVAFVKHATVAAESAAKYELLCKDGTRSSPQQNWEDLGACHLGKVPSHAVIMSNSSTTIDGSRVVQKLKSARSNIAAAKFMKGKNLLWGSKVVKFLHVTGAEQRPRNFIGDDYFCNSFAVFNRGRALPRKCTTTASLTR